MVARQSAVHAAFGANILQRCTGSFQLALFSSLFFLPLFLFSFPPPPPPPPFRLFTFFHVAHVTGLLERGSREGREEKAKVHRCEGEREERQTRSTRRVSQSNITVPRTTSKIAACLSFSSTPFSSFFSILALSTRWSRVEPRLSRFYVCFT